MQRWYWLVALLFIFSAALSAEDKAGGDAKKDQGGEKKDGGKKDAGKKGEPDKPAPPEPIKVGDAGRDLPKDGWLRPVSDYLEYKYLTGDVVIVGMWGADCEEGKGCKACVSALVELNKAYVANRAKGLHAFAFHAGKNTDQAIRVFLENDIALPVNTRPEQMLPYIVVGAQLPYGTVVGVDGKVIFTGALKDAVAEALKELKKAKYPGLGRAEINKKLDSAAKAFIDGKYGDARSIATAAKNAKDEEVAADAKWLLDRVTAELDMLNKKATDCEGQSDFLEALHAQQAIEAGFKGEDEEKKAKDKIREYYKSETKKQWKAQEDVRDLISKFDSSKPDAAVNQLNSFINKKQNENNRRAVYEANQEKRLWETLTRKK